MMEFIFIFFGFMIGCGVSYFYKNKKFSADDYVSRELFDEEKKRALDLNEEKLHLSREIAKYNEKISYQENIDWTRGRFSGQTIQIVVRDGKIMEKVFLTPKGNKISVKRSELGLLLR